MLLGVLWLQSLVGCCKITACQITAAVDQLWTNIIATCQMSHQWLLQSPVTMIWDSWSRQSVAL